MSFRLQGPPALAERLDRPISDLRFTLTDPRIRRFYEGKLEVCNWSIWSFRKVVGYQGTHFDSGDLHQILSGNTPKVNPAFLKNVQLVPRNTVKTKSHVLKFCGWAQVDLHKMEQTNLESGYARPVRREQPGAESLPQTRSSAYTVSVRGRANVPRIRQSRPDSGLGY